MGLAFLVSAVEKKSEVAVIESSEDESDSKAEDQSEDESEFGGDISPYLAPEQLQATRYVFLGQPHMLVKHST